MIKHGASLTTLWSIIVNPDQATKQEIAAKVKKIYDSGLNKKPIGELCKEHNLTLGTYYRWTGKTKPKKVKRPATVSELPRRAASVQVPPIVAGGPGTPPGFVTFLVPLSALQALLGGGQ